MPWTRSRTPSTAARRHFVVVEAYDGWLEHVAADDRERRAARGLGLPLGRLARRLDADITVMCWDDLHRYEAVAGSFASWIQFPATRPRACPPPAPRCQGDARVTWRSVPPRDPFAGEPFALGPTPNVLGLLANSDPLFLASCCLDAALRRLAAERSIDLVVLPAWGGLGYMLQFARATNAPDALDVPVAVVLTDRSERRHAANQEGLWTRPAITRRQMEDVSIALADLALAFGQRGRDAAIQRRLPDAPAPIPVPRRRPATLAAHEGRDVVTPDRISFTLHEPLDAASGVLTTLDAWRLLRSRASPPPPIVVSGPDCVFAPMTPRTFREYWSGRGFARELAGSGRWTWSDTPPADGRLTLRLCPSVFEHLPDPWTMLAGGALPVASRAARDGTDMACLADLAPCLDDDPTPAAVATVVDALAAVSPDRLRTTYLDVCHAVRSRIAAEEEAELDPLAHAIAAALESPPRVQDLSNVAQLFTDRTLPLREIATDALTRPSRATSIAGVNWPEARPQPSPEASSPGSLAVVVTCYDMGTLLGDAVRSIWGSSRVPDELVLVDDGSTDPVTLATIGALAREARTAALPFTVVRTPNGGLAAARNTGLDRVSTEFVSFFDGDDLIEPAFYESAVALMTRHPGLGGVACWALCFSDERIEGYWNAPQPELPLLLVENTVVVPCVMRTADVRALGGYDTRQRFNYEDWELALRLLASGRPIVTIPRYLERYRVRGTSLLRTMTPVQHQHMREVLLDHHRPVFRRFAVEVAMLVEGQLARLLHSGRS